MMTAQNKLVAAALVAATCAFVPASSAADPIILNADFSLGNTGFSSAHGYVAYPSVESPGLMYPEGLYTVGANPGFVHDRWADFGDHTTGGGLMMIVNGHRAADMLVWSTTVTVDPDTQYDFSAWAASVYPRSPSGLAFSVNGTLLGPTFLLPSATGSWQQFTAAWYSGSYSTAVLSVINVNTEWNGNDFALDDIALTVRPQISDASLDPDDPEIVAVPEPGSTLLLLASGLAGLAGYARRRNRREPI